MKVFVFSWLIVGAVLNILSVMFDDEYPKQRTRGSVLISSAEYLFLAFSS